MQRRLTRLKTLLEDSRSAVTKQWIEGIRKSWKLWTKQVGDLEGFTKPGGPMEHDRIVAAVKEVGVYMDDGIAYLRRLRDDLLINKGFWVRPGEDGKLDLALATGKGKVVQLLHDAEQQLQDFKGNAQFWALATDPINGRDKDDAYQSQEKYDRYLRTVSLAAKEGVTNADAIVSRKLLKLLSTLSNESMKSGAALDFEGYEPESVALGDVTVVFNDSAANPARRTPETKDPKQVRHPSWRKHYIGLFKETRALLSRRGLDALWYGKIEIRPTGQAPKNPHGDHFQTGAEYYRHGDYLVVYSDPFKGMPHLIAHELGHRYYYKFMTLADRERFGEWFGKVQATSEYGASISAEDFAEVFASYVMGTDLTRDQVDRLKAFLMRSKKLESIKSLTGALREASKIAIGDCYGYAYKRVQKRGGTLCQGTVVHPWDKNDILHAWVEDKGKVYDYQTEVMGRDPMAIEAYYKSWKPRDVKKYTAEEAQVQLVKQKHFGPWA